MRIEKIIKLAIEAAEGKDNFKEGAVGSSGYGFVFKDFDSHPNEPYIVPWGSSHFCGAGANRDFTKKLMLHNKSVESFSDLYRYDFELDLLFAGSLKTLMPALKFGGYESLFNVWMLVKTPEDRILPATIYWGQSGLSIGGWSKLGIRLLIEERSSLEYISEFMTSRPFSSPFQFTTDETGCFLDALEFALKKVPPSDFWGIYNHDLGNSYMGIRKGAPFRKEMGYFERDIEAEEELEPILGKEFKDDYKEVFIINLLPGRRIYAVEFENDATQDKLMFGNAAKVLEYWKSQYSEKYREKRKQRSMENVGKALHSLNLRKD